MRCEKTVGVRGEMSSHDMNLSHWLATPEGPPERIWQTALRLIAPEEGHTGDHADQVVQDQGLDQEVEDAAVEDSEVGLADAEPHTADERAPVANEEDFGVDPFS